MLHEVITYLFQILTCEEQTEVLSLQFVKFEENMDRKSGGVDMSVNLSIAALKFVFINKFTTGLLVMFIIYMCNVLLSIKKN